MSKKQNPDFQRKKASRIPAPKVMIACEGAKTEREYFLALSRELKLTSVIILVPHEATDPRNIVEQAKAEMKKYATQKAWEINDATWAVFDGDEHLIEDPNNWNDALQIAQGNGIKLAISNPSFEFWYLLHFRDHNAFLTRQQALTELKKHVQDYEKATCPYPKHIDNEATISAIERARKIARRAALNDCGLYENPCTYVGELVESLFSIHKQLYPEE